MSPQIPAELRGGTPAEPSEREFHISEYLQVLRRHWRLIAIAIILGGLVGFFRYSTTPKGYKATTRIQIVRRTPSPLSSQNFWMEAWWNPEFYPTQYKLLESRGMAEQVARDLRLWESSELDPGVLTTSAEGLVTAAADSEALARFARRLRAGVEIRAVTNTQLVDIVYRSADPDFAMRVANGYADAFKDLGITRRHETVTRASNFLEAQIELLKDEIGEKDRMLQIHRREADFGDIDPDSSVALQRLEAVNKDYMEARSTRIQREVSYNEILTTPAETIATTDSLVRQLRSRLLQLEQEYAVRLKTYKPEWPAMKELKGQIDEAKERLAKTRDDVVRKVRERVRGEFQSSVRGEAALKRELDEMKAEMLNHNQDAVEYNNLKVEILTRRELLDDLLRRQSEAGVAIQGSQESTVRVIDRALLPNSPYQPHLRNDLSSGLGVGLLLGVGLGFLLHFMDRTIKSGEDLERLLGLPTLAVISDVSGERGGSGYLKKHGYGYGYGYGYGQGSKTGKRRKRPKKSKDDAMQSIELLPQMRPKLAVSEAYRSLRTALLLSTADKLETIVVTSATAGEGKTVTAVNIATVMAQLGRRVLLIDADLRKPRVHEIFKVSNRVGVVSFLVGRAQTDEIYIQNGIPNLAVTPAGPIPPNPSELLSSDRMRQLVDHARSQFDFIIIDTPPALAVTDSTLMGDIADGVVLCVHAGGVSRAEIKACRDRLQLTGVKILGTVLNRYRSFGPRYGKSYDYHYEADGDDAETSKTDSQQA